LFGSTQRKPMRNVHSGAGTGAGSGANAGMEESGEVPGDSSNALELSTVSQLHRGGGGGGGGGEA
jgi:hypothetical protein